MYAVSAGAPGTTLQVDDRLYAWEAMSLLLASDDVPQETQAACVQGLLQQLCTQLRSNLEGDLSSIAVMGSSPPASAAHPSLALTATASHAMLLSQALEAVARLSKGFSQDRMTKLRPHIGAAPSSLPHAAVADCRFPAMLQGSRYTDNRDFCQCPRTLPRDRFRHYFGELGPIQLDS